ncbi:MAG: hypothetical protein ACLTT2_04375 [Alphaproteobacteria bacterium]
MGKILFMKKSYTKYTSLADVINFGCLTIWKKTEANLALSLNRRVNPTTAYIRLGEHTYELDLTTAPL